MILRYVMSGMLAIAVFLSAEPDGTCGSPYSANGIGTVIPDNVGGAMSMGGAGIANGDGSNLLRDNPALLSTSDKFSFSVGIIYNSIDTNIDLSSVTDGGDAKETFAKTNPNVLKIILPITNNVVLGWGFAPYSMTDVTILMPDYQNAFDESQILIHDELISTGGINVSSAGIAVSIKDLIHAGFSFNYNFGMIQEEWKRTFPDNDNYLDALYTVKKKFKGYSKTVGILANVHRTTSIGIGYTSKSDLDNNSYARSGSVNNPDFLLGTQTKSLPESWRIGIFSRFWENLQAGMDITFSQWEDAARTQKEKEMYTNTYSFGAGIRYIPSTRINAPYYMRLPLSAGYRFGTLYYKSFPIRNTVSENAVTFGIEFPLLGELGSIITSFEYGFRGKMDKNGWDEQFMGIGVSLITKIN